MSTTPNNTGSSPSGGTASQPEQQLPAETGGGSNKKSPIKKLLSFSAIFICMLLIIGAIGMHLRQEDHLGRLNYDYHSSGQSSEVSEIERALSSGVITPPPTVVTPHSERDGASDACLDCIATTATENKPGMCSKRPCGVFRIYRPYWEDAVRAVPPHFASQSYESCVSNRDCGAELVRSYMKRYGRDCNLDGVISCRDHIMLHQLGPTGCLTKRLQTPFWERMHECLRVKGIE